MDLCIGVSGRVVVDSRPVLGRDTNNSVFMNLRISEDDMSGRAVVAGSGDDFLDANDFIPQTFESDEVDKSGKIHPRVL